MLKVEREGLIARWHDGPRMFVFLIRGEEVGILLSRLAGDKRKYQNVTATYDSEIRIVFEDIDEALDEINTLIEIQSTLQSATDGLIYTSWNQNFFMPEK